MRDLMRPLICWSMVLLAAACGPDSPFVGTYYRGDKTGFKLMLSLRSRGAYTAELVGCVGTYGLAEGTWSRDGDFLILEPGREEGEMKGQLRRLKIVVDGASPVFVPEEELRSEHFLRDGANNFIGFHRLEDRD